MWVSWFFLGFFTSVCSGTDFVDKWRGFPKDRISFPLPNQQRQGSFRPALTRWRGGEPMIQQLHGDVSAGGVDDVCSQRRDGFQRQLQQVGVGEDDDGLAGRRFIGLASRRLLAGRSSNQAVM